jgi:glycosyltransferase involved in cell wall biosynthesis
LPPGSNETDVLAETGMTDTRIRVLRIIARLNVGGTAVHVTLLTKYLDRERFETVLVSGTENPGEGTMIDFTRAHGIEPMIVPEMVGQATLAPRDAVALWRLVRLMRRYRPHIVDTHTAKAGSLGRVAAWMAGVPVIVHTYHGHVLEGYYDPVRTRLLRVMERGLARLSTRLLVVSRRVGEDLVRLGAVPADKIEVVPLGMDLAPFLDVDHRRGRLRREFGIPDEAPIVAIVSRIFAIKNHALFIDAAARVLRELPDVRFLIVGDGILRPAIEQQAARLGIQQNVIFTGWRRDLAEIYADTTILVVSSNNEGTPVSAIEAMASAVPVVATRVGGLPDLIRDGETGVLVPPRSIAALSDALVALLKDPSERRRLGTAARADAVARFSVDRLIEDTTRLYDRLLSEAIR